MVDAGFCQAVLDAAPLGFVALELDQAGGEDERLTLVYANRAASFLTGVDLDRWIGRPIGEAFPWMSPKRLRAYAQVCRGGEPRTIGAVAQPGEGGGRTFNVGAFPGPEGSVVIVRALNVPAGWAAAVAAEGSTWRVRRREVGEIG